jgi:hypothetical protein
MHIVVKVRHEALLSARDDFICAELPDPTISLNVFIYSLICPGRDLDVIDMVSAYMATHISHG